MTARRVALAILVFALVLYGVLLASIATGNAQEAGDVGCATVEIGWNGKTPYIEERIEQDEGVSTAVVGHYLWIQFAHTQSSSENVVSAAIPPEATVLTICTDFVPEGEVIPTGPGTKYEVELTPGDDEDRRVVVASSMEPHPTIVDAWITEQGYVVQ